MIKSEDLKLGQARVLETDNNLILPVNKWIRLLVTGVNVIHSLPKGRNRVKSIYMLKLVL